jgi:hypothetical protein
MNNERSLAKEITEGFEALKSMRNNEPIAWYNSDDSSLSFKNHGGGWQPLYTHPVKELTDEEILRIADSIVINDRTLENFSIDFAKAILRKAQEK